MTVNKYFLDELDYLKQMRNHAAHDNRDIAPFLSADSTDPDVERLFEGFAFLTGRLREKLDDEFPEIIQSLLGLWWPHYLRPIPAMSILQFEPNLSAFSETQLIKRGTQVQSKKVDGSRCLFRTSGSVALHPLTLEKIELVERSSSSTLSLTLTIWPNAGFASTEKGLRFYLSDQHDRAADLYRYLLAYSTSVEAVCTVDAQEVSTVKLPSGVIKSPERSSDEALLPESGSVSSGYLALQEYFCFPSQQMFVDILGLSGSLNAAEASRADTLTIKINFDRPFDFSFIDKKKLMQLNCVPIVNLFEGTAKPIVLQNNRNEYPLTIESTNGMTCELYSVDACSGFSAGSDAPSVFHRFESFDHQSEIAGGDYFRQRHSQTPDGLESNVYLSFVRAKNEKPRSPSQTVSIDVTCNNGNLPFSLNPGEVSVYTSSSPEFSKFNNLTRPTRHILPPLGEDTLWKLISNMSINYTSLLTTDSLRTVLRTYDFLGSVDGPAGSRTDRILESLRVEKSGPSDYIYQGLPVRGVTSEISVSSAAFRSKGEVYAFGEVLDRFLAVFSGINSFHQLTLRERDSDEVFRWPPRTGNRSTL